MSSLHATVERAVNHGRLSLFPLPLITSRNLCLSWLSTGVDANTSHACRAMLLPRCHHISLFPISFPVPSLWWSSSDAGLTEMSEQKFKIALDFNLFGCFIATPVRGWLWRAKVAMENGVLVSAAIFCLCPSLLFCRFTKVRGFLLFPTFIKF